MFHGTCGSVPEPWDGTLPGTPKGKQRGPGIDPGKITLLAADTGEGVALEVRDDGPGFPATLVGSPIQAFRTRRPGGTGLGLAMVERTVKELGGQVALSNREGGGASVRLLLPHVTVEAG